MSSRCTGATWEDELISGGGPDRELQARAVAAEAEGQRALLDGRPAAERFVEASGLYRESWELAPPNAYGRLVGMLKAGVIAGDADELASYALAELGPDRPDESPTASYARAVAELVVGHDADAARAAGRMGGGGEAFARAAEATAALAAGDGERYAHAVRAIVADFEARDAHLTGVAFADTALMLERLAAARGLDARPASPLLPPT